MYLFVVIDSYSLLVVLYHEGSNLLTIKIIIESDMIAVNFGARYPYDET